MAKHRIGTQAEWQAERDELLKEEKELTRRGDELAEKRRRLPWVPVEKDYRFETERGTRSLADLFAGRSQLLVYHFMFGPSYDGGLPGLLLDRGHARSPGAAPQGQGHHAAARVPRAAREPARLPGADGLGHRLGLERRQRLQPRHRLPAHGGGAEAVPRGRHPGHRRPERGDVRHERRGLRRRGAGPQRLCGRGRGRLPDVRQHVTRPRAGDGVLLPARPRRRRVATKAAPSRTGCAATTSTRHDDGG